MAEEREGCEIFDKSACAVITNISFWAFLYSEIQNEGLVNILITLFSCQLRKLSAKLDIANNGPRRLVLCR